MTRKQRRAKAKKGNPRPLATPSVDNRASVANRLDKVIALLRKGRDAAAEAKCRQVQAHWPDHPHAAYLLGIIAIRRNDFQGAAKLLARAATLDPSAVAYASDLGVALYRLGKLEEAVATYRRAIDIDPSFAVAYYNLARALTSAGRSHEAIAACRRALELNGDAADIWSLLGRTSPAFALEISRN